MTIKTAPRTVGEPVSERPDPVIAGRPVLQPGE
jgi:hypothetical protein